MSDFPTCIEDLTLPWLNDKLGLNSNDFHAETLGEGGGLLGMVTRVHLSSDQGDRSVIAKFPTQAPENRGVADVYDMYNREYRYYTQVAPHVPLRSPACYHAEFNPDNRDFVLLLEDLQGFKLGDQVEGCSMAEAHQVVSGIASLHRNTWQPDHINDINRHDMPYQRDGMIGGYQVGWPVIKSDFSEFVPAEMIEKLEVVPDHVNSLLDQIHEGPLVIAHGDVRLDNIFFTDTGIAMVDYQAVCKGAPEHDLAYFVTQSLQDEQRTAEDWLAVYHSHLTSEGIEYDIDLSRHRYRLCAMYFICYAVIIAGTLDPANERGRRLGETLLSNAVKSLDELNTLEFIS